MKEYFKQESTVLFYGDSITDAGRDREDPYHMGEGYAKKAAKIYKALYPSSEIRFFNRGVGGDRLENLLERYEKEVVSLKPDFVSVLIGINDTWRRYDKGLVVTTEDFERQYRDLLGRLHSDFPEARILLIEPFFLPSDKTKEVFWEDLTPKIEVVRRLAVELADFYLPAGQLFEEGMKEGYSPKQLSEDGVHPTNIGHALLAVRWLQTIDVL